MKTRRGHAFKYHYIFFSRSGFTDDARAAAEQHNSRLVDLAQLDAMLKQALV